MQIVSRAQWGAKPWNGQPYSVPMNERTHFVVHYHGGPPPNATGVYVPRNVEAIHLGNGWSGVGYNFLVDQNGTIYEGRGWGLVGAHCPGRNRDGIGVYVAVGGDQEPTEAAKDSVIWLNDEADRRAGRTLTVGVHSDWYATKCAGPKLTPWVHGGMQVGRTGGAQSVPAPKPAPAPKPKPKPKPKRKKSKSPAFPLPRGHWYGVESNDPRNHSGYWPKDRPGIKKWQAQMRKRGWVIGVDGYFGPQSRKVCRQFQAEKGMRVDGGVGAATWAAAWTEQVT